MIQSNIKIHDQYQFEIKVHYLLNRESQKTNYKIDGYIFLPSNLNINTNTYPPESFYNDLHNYIRLKTPTVALKQIVDGQQSPFSKLKKVVHKLSEEASGKNLSKLENEIKLFCNIVRSSFRDHINFLAEKDLDEDRRFLIQQYEKGAKEVLTAYRQLRYTLNQVNIPDDALILFSRGDEYLSLQVETYLFSIFNRINGFFKNHPELEKLLEDFAVSEISYRKKNKYESILEEGSDNEAISYRLSALKKYIAGILFLDTRMQHENHALTQVVFAISAGLSMVFATAIAFVAQKSFGNFTTPFFVALVTGYMLKDRIKEVSKSFFFQRLKHRFYDKKTNISVNNKYQLGTSKESFSFANEKNIPRSILRQRNRQSFTGLRDGMPEENIIYYHSRFMLHSKSFNVIFPRHTLEGVNSILRFNVSQFLKQMDDPVSTLTTVTKEGIKSIPAHRVYHVNMLFRFSSSQQNILKHLRLVLNRNGIKRIEELS